ncbi:GntR family transcriptional regulator [Brevibacillus sp. SYP-B805]|uniref:GntR family transcriptional regulator n=1 Tax=Brevibacillus sp. SYP-B805 TaxID=1578199 RepID=UPI003217FFFD
MSQRIGEEEIYRVLKEAIFNAELSPGTQLVETSLAEAFGVSRTPIRAVLQRLKYESLIKLVPNRGAFVYCPSPDEAEQIFSLRTLLEGEAARLAAEHATPQQLEEMETFLHQEREYYRQKENHKALKAIADFHLTLAEASHNPFLISYLRQLISLSHIIFTFYDTTDQGEPHSMDEHGAILEAIKNRDGRLAAELASSHIHEIKGDVDFSKAVKHSLSIEQLVSRYVKR